MNSKIVISGNKKTRFDYQINEQNNKLFVSVNASSFKFDINIKFELLKDEYWYVSKVIYE